MNTSGIGPPWGRVLISGYQIIYKSYFILKGGILVTAIVGIDNRSTVDMDITINNLSFTEAELENILNSIINIHLEDHITFSLRSIEKIREETGSPGSRIAIDASFEKILQPLKIDITSGEIITPKEIEFGYRTMFENRMINIMAYNIETILAEKFETIISRDVANTRMKDFYDITSLLLLKNSLRKF